MISWILSSTDDDLTNQKYFRYHTHTTGRIQQGVAHFCWLIVLLCHTNTNPTRPLTHIQHSFSHLKLLFSQVCLHTGRFIARQFLTVAQYMLPCTLYLPPFYPWDHRWSWFILSPAMTLTEWLCVALVRVYQRANGRLKDVRKASLPDVYGTSGCWPECEMFLVLLLRTVVSNLTWTKKGQIVSRTD